jgi:hypothetical protein
VADLRWPKTCESPGLMPVGRGSCDGIVVANVSDAAGWQSGTVVVRVVNVWSEWHGDGHAIALGSIQLTIAGIEVAGIMSIDAMICANRWNAC